MDDAQLTDYLWPIAREMVKTAIENGQNLIVEGCYIPFAWQEDFSAEYLREIRYVCLVMSEEYITRCFAQIQSKACAIESRIDDGYTQAQAIADNAYYRDGCKRYGLPYYEIANDYNLDGIDKAW